MNDDKNNPTSPPPPEDAQNSSTPDAAEDLSRRLVELEQELDDTKSKMLRAVADYQNFVRRSQQEVVSARQQQLMEVARALLTVLDHFDRALEVDPAKVSGESLLQGLTIVRDELLKTQEKFGISRLEAKPGEPFDPNRHEALMQQQVEGIASGHVAAQLLVGYTIGEKTLRPAKVSVAQ